MKIRTVKATRYVTPLKEGGSMPAIVEADDDGLYVLKFRGAGQGIKALIAELISGEIGRFLGLPVPEIVFVELDPILGQTEADPEIQELIQASSGLNLALDYLPGSITFDTLIEKPNAELASKIVWFDAFTANVDRTPRNANMLIWHKELRLIDHGASIYFHHNWSKFLENAENPFKQIKDHILLPFTDKVEKIDAEFKEKLTPEILKKIIDLIPDIWFENDIQIAEPKELRAVYLEFFITRLNAPRSFVKEIKDAGTLQI
jgi:hypothetical protein